MWQNIKRDLKPNYFKKQRFSSSFLLGAIHKQRLLKVKNVRIYLVKRRQRGREGGQKIGKMGRRRLWMSPNYLFNFSVLSWCTNDYTRSQKFFCAHQTVSSWTYSHSKITFEFNGWLVESQKSLYSQSLVSKEVTKAESFYSVKYGSSNITSIVSSNNLFSLWVSRWVFINNQLYWRFLHCFDFNLKKNLVEKINIYNYLTVEQLTWYLTE